MYSDWDSLIIILIMEFEMSELLTIDEAAEMLKMHPETLRRKARFNEIPGFFKVSGKDWRIKREDLNNWIDQQKDLQSKKESE